MDKELYIKREEQLKKLWEVRSLVLVLEEFLIKNQENFKRKESIEALKKIRSYFELKQKEYLEIDKKEKEIYNKLYSTCKHEVIVKGNCGNPYYQCLICKRSSIEPKNSLISIDVTNDRQVGYIIDKIVKDVVHSDKDLMETISDAVEEMQYDRDIKVYRRSR